MHCLVFGAGVIIGTYTGACRKRHSRCLSGNTMIPTSCTCFNMSENFEFLMQLLGAFFRFSLDLLTKIYLGRQLRRAAMAVGGSNKNTTSPLKVAVFLTI